MILNNFGYSAVVLASLSAVAPASADVWTVDPANSTLGFEVQQAGNALKGQFTDWTAEIDFDPDAPQNAKISATIEPASATTGNAQFDGTLPTPDWFDTSAFPQATFVSEDVVKVEGTSYRANGTLSIKGVSQAVILDFDLDIDGDTAKATGTATVNRLEYKLGAAVGADTVGDAVTVTLDLTATR